MISQLHNFTEPVHTHYLVGWLTGVLTGGQGDPSSAVTPHLFPWAACNGADSPQVEKRGKMNVHAVELGLEINAFAVNQFS